MSLQFDLPKEQSSIIKVIGVGGGGSNAVNHMFESGIRGVNYVVCNTDQQALDYSPIFNKIQLGPEITQGLGAGSKPEVGEKATIESEEEIRELLSKNTKMVFVTAGMGGGTGTGGAPVVARIAKEMGLLTVAIVTTPFSFEGRRKLNQAEEGIKKLKENVDSIIVISNDKIREIFGNLAQSEAFSRADDILTMAAKSISEIITVTGVINVDFADVEYVMSNSGVAIMGTAAAEGEHRAKRAVQMALNSPLLNDNNITGAKNILINISSGKTQVTMDEISEINDYVQDAAGNDTDIIFGTCDDDEMGDKISVTIIATGFEGKMNNQVVEQKKIINLTDDKPKESENQSFNVHGNEPAGIDEITLKVTSDEDIQEEAPSEESNTFELFSNMEEASASTNEEEEEEDDELNFKVREEQEDEAYSFYTSNTSKPTQHDSDLNSRDEMDDRVNRLKNVSYKWENQDKVQEFEDIPAYMRRGVKLDEPPHSSENNVSKFTVNNFNFDGENRPEVRRNNSFLNDNVD